MKLHTRILLGLLAGVVCGTILALLKLGDAAVYLKPVGELFIKLLKMITIPLIMVSIMGATAGFSDLKKLGRVALKTIIFFIISTAIAVSLGITAANTFKPGQGLDPLKKQQILTDIQANKDWQQQLAGSANAQKKTITAFILELVPANPFTALANGDMLGVITFSLLLGLAFTLIAADKRQKAVDLLDAVNDALIALVKGVMKLAPLAVFTLITTVIAQFGFHFLWSLLGYCLLTIGTMTVFLFAYYSLAIMLLGRFNPFTFFQAMSSVGLLAFSTSSSNAVLPENMISCEQKLGVDKRIAAFVLPLGATINMSGTAIYQGISAIFIAQVFGLSLTIQQQLLIILTTTLAAVGTAGIPGIGIITLTMVLGSVGIPAQGIGLIIGVERILDMSRTVLNVLGDSATTLIVDQSEKRRERAKNA